MYSSAGISIDSTCGTPVVATPRYIDTSNARHLREALQTAVASGNTTVLDLSETDLCDLTAFGEIEDAHRRATADGGELRLVLPGVGPVFEITGLAGNIRLYPSLASALTGLPTRPL